MSRPMLQVTYRGGRAFAAYLHLVASKPAAAVTRELSDSLVGDFDASGALVGLEILAFDAETLSRINAHLADLGMPALDDQELAPLRAA